MNWYKNTLKGTLKEAEIDGLLEGVTNKTKSPSFEVQITLHIVQAQVFIYNIWFNRFEFVWRLLC